MHKVIPLIIKVVTLERYIPHPAGTLQPFFKKARAEVLIVFTLVSDDRDRCDHNEEGSKRREEVHCSRGRLKA